MNGDNVEKVYRLCAKRERDREREARKTKRRGKIRSALHFCFLDFEKAEALDDSPAWISDNGKGAEEIIAACDGETPEARYRRILRNARDRLRRAHPELVEVFNLIVKNGSNRKESIWTMVSRKRTNGRQQETDTGRI